MNLLSEWLPPIFFYSVPFIAMFFSKWMNSQFKAIGLAVKVVDVIIPYMIVILFIVSHLNLPVNLVPYLILVISVTGILLVSYSAFYKKELDLYLFFRFWWRVVFIITLIVYIGSVFWLLMQ